MITIEQAIDAAYAADDRPEAEAAIKMLNEATKDIPLEDFPERCPEAIGAYEMLEQMLLTLP